MNGSELHPGDLCLDVCDPELGGFFTSHDGDWRFILIVGVGRSMAYFIDLSGGFHGSFLIGSRMHQRLEAISRV